MDVLYYPTQFVQKHWMQTNIETVAFKRQGLVERKIHTATDITYPHFCFQLCTFCEGHGTCIHLNTNETILTFEAASKYFSIHSQIK